MSIIFILFAVFAIVVIVSSIGRRSGQSGPGRRHRSGESFMFPPASSSLDETWPAVIIIIIAVRATLIRDAPPIQAVGAAGLTAAEAAGVEETTAAAVAAVVEIPEAAAAVAAEIDGRKGR